MKKKNEPLLLLSIFSIDNSFEFDNINKQDHFEVLLLCLEASKIGITMIAENGNILYSNSLFSEVSKIGETNYSKINIFNLKDDIDCVFIKKIIKCILNKENWYGNIEIYPQNDLVKTYNMAVNKVMMGSQGFHYMIVYNNISYEVDLQKQLKQAQKLEAIGTLAGGIAHDFNNILTSIMGFAELSIYELSEIHPIYDNLKYILKSSQRAKELIANLLTFSRQRDYQFVALNIIPLIKESLNLIRASIPANIEIISKYLCKNDQVFGEPTKIHQIVLNLCTNAFQSMQAEGGRLELVLQQEYIAKFADENSNLKPGEYIHLSISDTGIGIAEHFIPRVFDPYFSTKNIGEGTGLGLSVVHGIVSSMQGFIKVESKIGSGTTFHVYIPNYSEQVVEYSETKIITMGNRQVVMVVDDEVSINKVFNQMLNKLNYDVYCFEESEKALADYLDYPEKYDLIITDLSMPKMTGIDLIKEIRSISLSIPIILCTGYSEFLSDESIDKYRITDYMVKPVSIYTLSDKLAKTFNLE